MVKTLPDDSFGYFKAAKHDIVNVHIDIQTPLLKEAQRSFELSKILKQEF